jgi:hypothetical protein
MAPFPTDGPTLQRYLTPNDHERGILIATGIMAGVILILWNVPYLKLLLYPFKVSLLDIA